MPIKPQEEPWESQVLRGGYAHSVPTVLSGLNHRPQFVDPDEQKAPSTESASIESVLVATNIREPLQISCLF